MLSILTAIFQAIAQAVTFIFPVSESGHSAIFHDFSSRFSGAVSELTGLVHIGIAIGIAVAFHKVFARHIYEFLGLCRDIKNKKFDIKKGSYSRNFLFFTLIPYPFMLLYLIPVGNGINLFELLSSYSIDGNLISEGICFLFSGGLLLLASYVIKGDPKGGRLTLPAAGVLSFMIFISIPMAGLSLSTTVICVAIICAAGRNHAFRYFVSVSVPVLLVTGISEIVRCVTYVTVVEGIIAVVISGAVSFFAVRAYKWLLHNVDLKYFSYYNFALAVLTVVTGIVELFIR